MREILFGFVFASFLVIQVVSWRVPDNMAARRSFVEGFGLGPAPFPDFEDMKWELFGDAFLQHDSVKVTDAVQHQKGAIWSKNMYSTKATNDFQLDLSFRVGGLPGKMFGDGFALWFVDRSRRGVGGDALGGPNEWTGMAIFFDTFNNQQLKGKKHPYVYGYVNDGTKNYNDITNSDLVGGCHIPLRSFDEGVLESTRARVTYMNNNIHVMIQPYDADDWLQCFKIPNVKLIQEGYIGVTAMTGEVVDKHSMISVQLYNNLKKDPWDEGIDFQPHQMPVLWEDMKNSGVVAREFEEWEKEIEEEVDEFSLHERYADYYYIAANNYLVDDVEDMDEDSDYYGSTKPPIKFVKPSIKNNFRRDQIKSDSVTIQLSNEEIEKIDEMLAGTSIAQEIEKLNTERRKRIRNLRKHMEAEFEDASNQMNDLVKTLRKKEFEWSRRIENLGVRYNLKLKRVFKKHERNSGAWFYPFIFVGIIICIISGLAFYMHRQNMKSHLL